MFQTASLKALNNDRQLMLTVGDSFESVFLEYVVGHLSDVLAVFFKVECPHFRLDVQADLPRSLLWVRLIKTQHLFDHFFESHYLENIVEVCVSGGIPLAPSQFFQFGKSKVVNQEIVETND
jgi:hypothetical protein